MAEVVVMSWALKAFPSSTSIQDAIWCSKVVNGTTSLRTNMHTNDVDDVTLLDIMMALCCFHLLYIYQHFMLLSGFCFQYVVFTTLLPVVSVRGPGVRALTSRAQWRRYYRHWRSTQGRNHKRTRGTATLEPKPSQIGGTVGKRNFGKRWFG